MKALYIIFACQGLVVAAQQLPTYYQQFNSNNGLRNWWDYAKHRYYKQYGNINHKGAYNTYLPFLTNNVAHYGRNGLVSGHTILNSAETVQSNRRSKMQDLANNVLWVQRHGNQYDRPFPAFKGPDYSYVHMSNNISNNLNKKLSYGVHNINKVNPININLQQDLTRSLNPPKINENHNVSISNRKDMKTDIEGNYLKSLAFMQQEIVPSPYDEVLRNKPENYAIPFVQKHPLEISMKSNTVLNSSVAEDIGLQNYRNKTNINSLRLVPAEKQIKPEDKHNIPPLKDDFHHISLNKLTDYSTLPLLHNTSEPELLKRSKIPVQDSRKDNRIMDKDNLMKVKSVISTPNTIPYHFSMPDLQRKQNVFSYDKPVNTTVANKVNISEKKIAEYSLTTTTNGSTFSANNQYDNKTSNEDKYLPSDIPRKELQVVHSPRPIQNSKAKSNLSPHFSIPPEYSLNPFNFDLPPIDIDDLLNPKPHNNDSPLKSDCKDISEITGSLLNNLNIRDMIKEKENLKLLFKILRLFILRERIINETFSVVVDKISKTLIENEDNNSIPIEREREIARKMIETELSSGDLHRLFLDVTGKREKDLTSAINRLKLILFELRQILFLGGLSKISIESIFMETLSNIVPKLSFYFLEECKKKTSNFIITSLISALDLSEPYQMT